MASHKVLTVVTGFIRPAAAATERRKLRWRSRQPHNGNVTATETTINYMPVKGKAPTANEKSDASARIAFCGGILTTRI